MATVCAAASAPLPAAAACVHSSISAAAKAGINFFKKIPPSVHSDIANMIVFHRYSVFRTIVLSEQKPS
jgi:hypothetical protein